MSKYETEIDATGPNGNIFSIMGAAQKMMRQLGEPDADIKALQEKVTSSGSYQEALDHIRVYFPVEA